MKSGFLLGSQHMPHLISLFLFISINQTREFTNAPSILLGKELRDWWVGPRIALGRSFGLCGQVSLIIYPKGLHCVFWFITLLEEIGQLLLWERCWESSICKMCFISKPVAYRQHEFRRSNLEGNFKHILCLESLGRVSPLLACLWKWRITCHILGDLQGQQILRPGLGCRALPPQCLNTTWTSVHLATYKWFTDS